MAVSAIAVAAAVTAAAIPTAMTTLEELCLVQETGLVHIVGHVLLDVSHTPEETAAYRKAAAAAAEGDLEAVVPTVAATATGTPAAATLVKRAARRYRCAGSDIRPKLGVFYSL